MGAINLGRDIFSRVVYAAQVDLQLGLILTYVPLVYESSSRRSPGLTSAVGAMRSCTLRRCRHRLSFLVLVIAILAVVGPGVRDLHRGLAVTWAMYARLTRAEMSSMNNQFILAGEALGFSRRRIIFRRTIPNLLRPNLVFSAADFVLNVLLVASLSFLGLGVRPATPGGERRWSPRDRTSSSTLGGSRLCRALSSSSSGSPSTGRRRPRGPPWRALPAHHLRRRADMKVFISVDMGACHDRSRRTSFRTAPTTSEVGSS